jgi:hypothetical protein
MRAPTPSIPAAAQAEYADVVNVDPITEKQKLYAQVIGTERPVRETSTVSTPHEECNDVAVQEAGTPTPIHATSRHRSLGAVIGGLVLATSWAAGTGKKLGHGGRRRRRRVRSRAIEQRHCAKTKMVYAYRAPVPNGDVDFAVVPASSPTNVTYRNPDGTTGTSCAWAASPERASRWAARTRPSPTR